jgi:hypothetical protein
MMITAQMKGLAVGAVLLGVLSLGGSALAGAPAPRLSFPCSTIPPAAAQPEVTCRLAGHGFAPREKLAIAYRVEIQWMQGAHTQNHVQVTTYRRRAVTDGHGSFERPPFSFTIPTGTGVRVWKIAVQVQVNGERGDHAAISTVGMAD